MKSGENTPLNHPPSSIAGLLSRGKSIQHLTKDTVALTALRTLLLDPHSHLHDSTLVLKAITEMFGFLIVFPLTFTLAFHPESVLNNQILRTVGYNNPCFMFDTVPARYVAAVLYAAMAHLVLLHAQLGEARLQHSRG